MLGRVEGQVSCLKLGWQTLPHSCKAVDADLVMRPGQWLTNQSRFSAGLQMVRFALECMELSPAPCHDSKSELEYPRQKQVDSLLGSEGIRAVDCP